MAGASGGEAGPIVAAMRELRRPVVGRTDSEAALLDQVAAIQALTGAALKLRGLLDLSPGGAGVERMGDSVYEFLLNLVALPRKHG